MAEQIFRLGLLLGLAERDEQEQEYGYLPYPPEMPGDPKRVQISLACYDDGSGGGRPVTDV
ncbi:hypothetical protein [Streptomyces sp. NPDC001770]